LTKAERKKLCGLMDVRKLTADASMHAAQNECLPLRVVVQVLFFDQVRSSISFQSLGHNSMYDPSSSPMNRDEGCKKTMGDNCQPFKNQVSHLRIKDEELHKNGKLGKNSKNSKSGLQLLPSRSRRIFDKLWSLRKVQGENRSSETSGSSSSPTSIGHGDTKSYGLSLRHQRHSIS